jgi:hypothetical protein
MGKDCFDDAATLVARRTEHCQQLGWQHIWPKIDGLSVLRGRLILVGLRYLLQNGQLLACADLIAV